MSNLEPWDVIYTPVSGRIFARVNDVPEPETTRARDKFRALGRDLHARFRAYICACKRRLRGRDLTCTRSTGCACMSILELWDMIYGPIFTANNALAYVPVNFLCTLDALHNGAVLKLGVGCE